MRSEVYDGNGGNGANDARFLCLQQPGYGLERAARDRMQT